MAGRIPQAFIDEVVARSDIVEIVGSRVALKKSGREYKACCPFHAEKTPSFWVSPDKQFYHCFGCGAHGTAVGFLMQFEKLEFPDAIALLAERAGLEVPRESGGQRPGTGDLYELMTRAARFFEQNLQDDARARAYLAGRGVGEAAAADFALGYAPDSWNALLTRLGGEPDGRRRLLQAGLVIEREPRGSERSAGLYDRFRDRLMFPIRDARGRVIGFGGRVIGEGEPKYLNSPETPLFHKGRELYGLYEARRAGGEFQRLVVVEGYMDVVRLHQAGIRYAVATLGTSTTQEHLHKIFRLTGEVVFSFDGDRAGRAAAWRALENALPLASDGRELKFLFLPEGEDPDTLVAAEGAAGFEQRLQAAWPLSEYLVRHLLAEVDLQHIDGRAKLAALARPLFSRLPEGVYRELLVDRLAAEIRMPAARLGALLTASPAGTRSMSGSGRATPPRTPTQTTGVSAGRGNLLRQAIGLVLHHPTATHRIDWQGLLDHLKPGEPGTGVLRELIEQARTAAEPTTAMLLERWRDRPEFARLQELAARAPLVGDPEAAAQELRQAVGKLAETYGSGRRVDELLRKAEETGLNSAEKTELSLLLQARSRPTGRPAGS
ncbi:MAG: DNA primase [Gammaproteobacteria bacterium]|nr:DNA primase [Gammaproteobacteria bacterium]